MAYTKTTWVNDQSPDINADNLNKMEQGIADAQFPDGGTAGQFLKKGSNGVEWGDVTDPVWGNITGTLADQTDLKNALDGKVDTSSVGVASGVASLDSGGKVPSAQLPSYVDDVLEYASVSAFPATGETGKIYVALDTNDSYRWSGSEYIKISNPVDFDNTPVQNSTKAVTSGGLYNEFAKAYSDIAPVETSPAVSAHAEGDLIVYNGQLYTVTTAIAIGDSLTVGTNISATSVSDEVSELNGTLTGHTSNTDIHVTATDKANWNAKADDSAVVKSVNSVNPVTGNVTLNADNIPAEGYGNKSVSGNPITITDGTATTAKNLDVSLTPIQDLHGYDNPWPEGGGKNLLPMTVEGIKAVNTEGTWSGNEYALNGITYKILTDSGNNVIGINANGTASAAARFYFYGISDASSYAGFKFTGCPSGGGYSTYRMMIQGGSPSYTEYAVDNGNGATISNYATGFASVWCSVYSEVTVSNIVFKPMICPATEPNPDYAHFAPYSNICPISGSTEVNVNRCGKNLFNSNASSAESIDITGGGVIRYGHTFESGQYTIINNGATGSGYYYRMPKKDLSNYGSSIQIYDSVNVTVDNEHMLWVFTSDSLFLDADKMGVFKGLSQTWSAYQGTTATITLGQTVSQGTVDFDTGLMTVTRGFAEFDGSNDEDWRLESNTSYLFTIKTELPFIDQTANTVIQNWISSYSNPIYFVRMNAQAITHIISYDNAQYLYFFNGVISDVNSLRTYLASNPLQVVFEFATPLTVQLTPAQLTLLEGYNYITTNANSISLDYYGSEATNVQAEINEFETKIDRLAGSIAQIEVSPATATHKVGDLIVWNSQLYKVMSAIAVGETLSVGSNVAATSVGDLRKKLLWTNPNSSNSQSFAAQNIPVDLNGYSGVEIEFIVGSARVVNKSVVGFAGFAYFISANTSDVIVGYQRSYSVNLSGITFNDCDCYSPSGTSTLNVVLIPYKIYGIK